MMIINFVIDHLDSFVFLIDDFKSDAVLRMD